MNITANTPQPKKPPQKKGGRNYLSWIIFLFILIRPLWGILRSIAPSTISSQQIIMLVAGVLVVGVVAVIALRARDSRPSSQTQTTYSLPQTQTTYSQPQTGPSVSQPQTSTPSPYTQKRATLPAPPRPLSNTVPRAPQFEPAITGTVVLVGFVVAALIGGVILLITIVTP